MVVTMLEAAETSLDEVIITPELYRRPARAADHAAESRALMTLAETMAESPAQVLQKLADFALELCSAGSAGISVWEPDEPSVFRWRATAGAYARYVGGTLPRDFSPCGVVLDRRSHLLMSQPVRAFPYIAELCAPCVEVLLVPFSQAGVLVGTVWVVAHEDNTHFDAEDARIVTSLTKFAEVAILTIHRIEAAQRSEQLRREREEHFRALVTATSDVVYRMSADWSTMYPVNGRSLIASNTQPLESWMVTHLPAFEHERVRAAIAAAIAGKHKFELEHQVIRPDGSLGWTFSRAIPILDAQGKIVEWLGAASDVTRSKEAEASSHELSARLEIALSESERLKRLYETALSNTFDQVYVFDLQYRFTFLNQPLLELLGKTWDEAIGKTCLEIGYDASHARLYEAEIDRVRETRQPTRVEMADSQRVFEYIFVPVFGATREVEAVAGTTRDITARKAMEQELRDADRKKDDFIATLAHELRNPLAPISTGVSLLSEQGDVGLAHKTLGVMRRQIDHMVRLIDDLLDVSRITRGKLELRRERVLLSQVVNAAIEANHLQLERARHTLHTRLSSEELWLDADQTRLAQIVGNLLNNACKYTPEGGEIEICSGRDGDEAVITVRDSGLGIPPDRIDDVFEMFSQVNRALDRSQGGLGIGLALVRRLVEMHEGSVSAFSEGPGLGSTFTVRLPLAHASELPRTAATKVSPLPAQLGPILVVDDNDDAAELLRLALEQAGHQVMTAADGRTAISTAECIVPSVFILDIGLPDMNGYELAQHFRRDQRFADTILIALTGWGSERDRLHAMGAGFDLHLTKPVSTRDLQDALGRALSLRDASQRGG